MIRAPEKLWPKDEPYLAADGVAENERRAYRKWLLFYLDLCHKHKHGCADTASVAPFLEKL